MFNKKFVKKILINLDYNIVFKSKEGKILKKIIYIMLAVIIMALSGCADKKVENPNIQSINSLTKEITVGNIFKNITLEDQFGKKVTLSNKTKKVIFVFEKKAGHTARNFIDSKSGDYLSNKNIAFIADISGMPSIIASMFAIPDFKKHSYHVMLIKDESQSKQYRNDKYENYIAVIGLNNFKITDIKLVSTAKQLKKILQ